MGSPTEGLDLERELTCSICTEVLYQPLTLLDCLHTFCGGCLKEWFAFQLASSRNSPNAAPPGASPFTCPSCRAAVRATKNNATVTTLLEMFLTVHPDKGRTAEEKEEVARKYTAGEEVMPKVEEREKTLRERRAEDEDRRLVSRVQAESLREVGVESPEERMERRRRREERRGETRERRRRGEGDSGGEGRRRREDVATMSAPSAATLSPDSNGLTTTDRRRRRSQEEARRSQDDGRRSQDESRRSQDEARRRTDEANRTAVRQIEHQSSLRSLISTSDVDSREMEEEILRQIREEGLLDGIDLENLDVSQEDQISERIAEAFRRRQRERSPAVPANRTRDRSASDRSDRRSAASNNRTPPVTTTRRRHHSRSLSATSQADEATRPSPRTSATHLEPQSSDEGRRRRHERHRSGRSATSPSPSSSPAVQPATRSQSDLVERPRSSQIASARPVIVSTETRSISEPTPTPQPTSTSVAEVVELATGRRRPPALPPREPVRITAEAEVASSPVELPASRTRSTSQASASALPSASLTATQIATQPGLIPVPASPSSHHHTSPPEHTTTLQATRPSSSSSAGSHRANLPLYPEPSIKCNRCLTPHIEYSLHYSCPLCLNGDYNLCLTCYRSGLGCLHWFGFGYSAWSKFEKRRASGQIPHDAEKPHMLYASRYLAPATTPGGADGRRTLTTDDPARRLQSGAFCAGCLAWANECYWRCDVCNEGDWGFCNTCVNQGRCCTHALLPLLHQPDKAAAADPPLSPGRAPRAATVLTGPGVVALGSFRPLSFRVDCDVCRCPIAPDKTRLHCFECTSEMAGSERGDYDVCMTCYAALVARGRISAENGPEGWRRCLRGHRMVVVGFEDARGGQRRVVVRDLVGGRGLYEDAATGQGTGTRKWTWGEGRRTRLVSEDVAGTAPGGAVAERGFPPDGGVGMRAVALWSWYPKEGEGANELLFPRGAEVREVVDVNGDWFHGVYMGAKGLFPAPYVRVIDGGA